LLITFTVYCIFYDITNLFRYLFCLIVRLRLQLRPDDGGQPRYEVPSSVVDVQLPAFSSTAPRRYAVNIIDAHKFAFQVTRQDTGTVLYARFSFFSLQNTSPYVHCSCINQHKLTS